MSHRHYHDCGPGAHRSHAGRRDRGDWQFGDFPWGPRMRRRWGGGRVFEQGDLKYVILQLLSEKPRHGYEIIKALEEKFAGAYAPSAGAVYPTLSLLEDLGYATVSVEEGGGGKKVYTITDEGRAYLAENKDDVDDIFEKISEFGAGFFSDHVKDVGVAFGRLARATFATSGRHLRDSEKAKQVKEVIDRAAKEIEGILSAVKG